MRGGRARCCCLCEGVVLADHDLRFTIYDDGSFYPFVCVMILLFIDRKAGDVLVRIVLTVGELGLDGYVRSRVR